LPVGTSVRLYALDIEAFVGEGRVCETHEGSLGPLLDQHAAMNHLMQNGPREKADTRLLAVLLALYGRNYARPTSVFSVVYVESK